MLKRKKKRKASAFAVDSAINHDFTMLDENQTVALDDEILNNLNQEIGEIPYPKIKENDEN